MKLKVYVCGHRNPDADSVTAAYALAELRRRTNPEYDYESICPGRLMPRVDWIFSRFGVPPPRTKGDVYVRVGDILSRNVLTIPAEMTLLTALRHLEKSGESALAVAARDGTYCGMLSPSKLLSYFFEKKDMLVPVSQAPLHTRTPVFSVVDRVHDVKAQVLGNAHNHFPVLDENGKYAGTILKSAFAETPPLRMILVDHNEHEQGIPGLEEIPVIEVVDHHRIAFQSSADPIRYTADAVGATCTLVARLFRGAGLRPAKPVAGILLAGIVADTLLFQSPTATSEDRVMAAWLEKIAGVSASELMEGMMSVESPLALLSPEKAIESDCKVYRENGFSFALAQLEETNLARFRACKGKLSRALESRLESEKLDFAALLVTDPVRGNSELLFAGDGAVRRALPWRKDEFGTFLLPGVLSRKKQLLPVILSSLPA